MIPNQLNREDAIVTIHSVAAHVEKRAELRADHRGASASRAGGLCGGVLPFLAPRIRVEVTVAAEKIRSRKHVFLRGTARTFFGLYDRISVRFTLSCDVLVARELSVPQLVGTAPNV